MKQLFYLFITSVVLFSCSDEPTKKFTDGTEYKIISDGKGAQVVNGNVIAVEILKKHKDSLLYDSRDIMPNFGLYDTAQFPPLFKEIFKNIRVGDSLYTRNLVDSIYKQGTMPAYAKKGDYEITTYKIVNVYTSKEQADSAYNRWLPIAKQRSAKKMSDQILKDLKANASQVQADEKIINELLTSKKWVAVKGSWGTYVIITTPGTGEMVTDTSIAVVNYTGRTLLDSVFDSNTDPKFGHVQPINVELAQVGAVIPGWTDGLKLLRKGSKAKFLIPSSLGYGKTGNGEKIKPNEILLFDIEVLDVLTPAQYQVIQMEQQRKMMEMQQQMQQQQQNPNK